VAYATHSKLKPVPIPDAVDTVVCAPGDGWKYHPKHVEQFPDINKMCNFASCRIYEYIGILLGAHPILRISRTNVNLKKCTDVHGIPERSVHMQRDRSLCTRLEPVTFLGVNPFSSAHFPYHFNDVTIINAYANDRNVI
jgi:hypothetical protein